MLLGTSNLVFWEMFVAADALAVGYVSTILHWMFVIAQLAAAVGGDATSPARGGVKATA